MYAISKLDKENFSIARLWHFDQSLAIFFYTNYRFVQLLVWVSILEEKNSIFGLARSYAITCFVGGIFLNRHVINGGYRLKFNMLRYCTCTKIHFQKHARWQECNSIEWRNLEFGYCILPGQNKNRLHSILIPQVQRTCPVGVRNSASRCKKCCSHMLQHDRYPTTVVSVGN